MHHRSVGLLAAAAAAVVALSAAALMFRRSQNASGNVYVIVGRHFDEPSGDDGEDGEEEGESCVVCGSRRVEFALAQRDDSNVVTFCSRGCLEQYVLYSL